MNEIILLCGLFLSLYMGALAFSFFVKWAETDSIPIKGFWADVVKPSFKAFGIGLLCVICITIILTPLVAALGWIRSNI